MPISRLSFQHLVMSDGPPRVAKPELESRCKNVHFATAAGEAIKVAAAIAA